MSAERPEAGCTHWDGRAYCAQVETRPYLVGERCADHEPRHEPGYRGGS